MIRQDYEVFFNEYEKGEVIEVLSVYPYLSMLMNLWPGYWKNNLECMNMKVEEENEKLW